MPFILSLILFLAPHTATLARCHHYSINSTSVPSVTPTTASLVCLTCIFGNGALSLTPSSSATVGAAGVVSNTSRDGLIAPVIALSVCLGTLLFLLVCLSLLLCLRRRRRLRDVHLSTTAILNNSPHTGPAKTQTQPAGATPEPSQDDAIVKTPSLSHSPQEGQSTQPHFSVSSQLDTECHCRGLTDVVTRPPSQLVGAGGLDLELRPAPSDAGSEQHNTPSGPMVLRPTSSAHEDSHHPEIYALVQENQFTKQAAAQMVPMKPKEGQVLPGYNPTLDEKRPQEIEEYLLKYRILFVIDDSGSMSGARWNETRDALSEIANHALNFHSDTVDMCFFNHSYRRSGLKGVQEVMNIFGYVRPGGGTPTGHVLERILDEKIRRLDEVEAEQHGRYASELPLDIIVLTDGVPDSNSPPAPVIDEAARRMKAKKHHPNWIGIQFVQIGNERAAEPTLISLIDSKDHNMVDTTSYSMYKEEGGGKLTAAVLERIILGALHPNLRIHWNNYRRQQAQDT